MRESANGTKKEIQETNEIVAHDEDNETKEKNVEMLLAEFTTATYPSGDKDIPDDVYYTFYTPDGIYCQKQGQPGFEWQIQFENKSQYEKVMSYLQSLDSQNNLRFACHENFWQDFLIGQVDMNYLDQYYAKNPNETGKRNHYYNGRWYSMVELAAIWNKELAELFD